MDKLKGKKILVTGGCGFIGSHIVDRLIEEEASVFVLDNLSTGTIDNIRDNLDRIEFIEGDIRDEKILDRIVKEVDYIIHQAALMSVPQSVEDPYLYHDVNSSGTLKLFLKAKEHNIKRIVYASSSSVYGEKSVFPEKEEDFPLPESPYGATKLFGDYYAYIFTKIYHLDVVSLRYFNVYGERQSLNTQYAVVIPKFISNLLRNQSPPIYGDGTQERDFVYVKDVAEANILALLKEDVTGEIINIASGSSISIIDLLNTLKEIIDRANIEPVYLPPREGDVKKTCADISKAKKLLGWYPKTDFYEGLKNTVEWFKKTMFEKVR